MDENFSTMDEMNPEKFFDYTESLFIDTLIKDVFEGISEEMKSMVKNNPPGRYSSPRQSEWEKWYQTLDESEHKALSAIIQETVKMTLFHTLV